MPSGTEKQASSEIAQSRERFDPFHELIVRHDSGAFGKPTSWQAMCGMLAECERDTRERCAQLAREYLKLWPTMAAELVERIRGKE